MAVAVALVFGDIGMGDQLDAMVGTWSALASQVAPMLPLVEAYVAKHPEQRVAIRRDGLQALMDRGEVVPFEPEELATVLGGRMSPALAPLLRERD